MKTLKYMTLIALISLGASALADNRWLYEASDIRDTLIAGKEERDKELAAALGEAAMGNIYGSLVLPPEMSRACWATYSALQRRCKAKFDALNQENGIENEDSFDNEEEKEVYRAIKALLIGVSTESGNSATGGGLLGEFN